MVSPPCTASRKTRQEHRLSMTNANSRNVWIALRSERVPPLPLEEKNRNLKHLLSSLCYRLTDQPISLEPLRILEERKAVWGSWKVTFFALGTSHAVRLQDRDKQITELLTCVPPPEGAGYLLQANAADPVSLDAQLPGLCCNVRLEPFALTIDDALRGDFAPDSQMHIAYPTEIGEREVAAPVTRIGWQIEGKHLLIQTVHTYPEEGRGVRSHTDFELM